MIYLVGAYKYREYKIISLLENLETSNKVFLQEIKEKQETLVYKSTRAYKNKVLKSEQWLMNQGEKVVFLIDEATYKKYTNTQQVTEEVAPIETQTQEEKLLESMENQEKWIYFLFGKDIR